jgi:hypothetical protein
MGSFKGRELMRLVSVLNPKQRRLNMRKVHLLLIAVAAICVLALAAFAVANRAPEAGDDVIIIKGGSLEIQCPPNQDKACLGLADITTGKYKHTKGGAHIMQIVVKDNYGKQLFSKSFTAGAPPTIEVTYK